ncbi:hypothetical protein EG329_005475 [Mollisiaceae sp. DMI_Dod_QoI]|nr:hypothetical protein EG329_005475 [Helotiales sp. DMI_Dod_QoI]
MGSEQLLIRWSSAWNTTKDKKKKHALAFSLIKGIKWPVATAILPRLALTALRFSQPLLLKRIVEFVGQPDSDAKMSIGYGLIGATALVYFGNGIVKSIFNYRKIQVMTLVRGSLISIILSKTLRVSATVAAAKGNGTLTLMSTDVENIVQGFQLMNDVWASPIEVAIALWLLGRELGIACIVPAIIATASTLVIFRISPLVGRAFAAWNKGIEERVSLTSSILGNMREVKLLGLTDRWAMDIQVSRVKELEFSKKARILSTYRLVLGRVSQYITPVMTFGVFIAVAQKENRSLSVSSAFTSLSLLSLLASPLSLMFTALPQTFMALACLTRIQDFLIENEKVPRTGVSDLLTIYTDQTFEPEPNPQGEEPSPESASRHDIELASMSTPQAQPNNNKKTILMLKDAAFGVTEDGRPIIHGINLTIDRSSLTLVIGKVGSGKSTLLRSLIGEIPQTAGSLQSTFNESSYCEQQPWLINDSIQNNILGHSNFEGKWYQTVVDSCALDKDFEALSLGGLTPIGSKGISLSGGQKARVALARAIYSRKEVAIIDDMLNGLDRTTEEFVWNNVFGPHGIFRQHGITVILATHSVRHLREVDNIIVLDENGTVSEQGTFDSLDLENGHLHDLIIDSRDQKSQPEIESNTVRENNTVNLTAAVSNIEQSKDDLLRQTGDLTLYKYYLKSVGWKDGVAILVLSVGSQFCSYFSQLWVKLWAEADTTDSGYGTGVYYGVYVMLGVLGLIFMYWAIYYSFIVITPKSGARLHKKLVDVIMGAPLSFFATTDTGVTVNRFSQDMSLLDIGLSPGAFLTLISLTSCVMGMALVIVSLPYMAAVIPFAAVFLYGLQLFYLRTSRQLRYMDLEAKSPLYTHLLETVQGLSSIRSFGWSAATLSAGLKTLDLSQRPFYFLYCIQQWLQLVLDLFTSALATLFVGIAVSTSSAGAGSIGLGLLSMLTLTQSLVLLITEWTELETSLGAIARLKDIETRTPNEAQVGETFIPDPSWPQHGNVFFNNVEAAYTIDAEPVLRDVSFRVEAGQKVAICGRTGSGKSSLLLSLFDLLNLRSGSITIDSVSTATLPRSILRSHLNVVPQDPVIFPGSVRLNALPHLSSIPSSEEGEIITALTLVGLWDTISSRGGLDADMSTIPLSQGERQLFCLARAWLRRGISPILVLDEATSNLDHYTEDLMQRIIREEWKGMTILAVVHRLKTVMDFDKIVVLEKGKLVEYDAPVELLNKEGGAFRALWNSRM